MILCKAPGSRDMLMIWLMMSIMCQYLITVNVYAANWAQASGKLQQNIAIPYLPSPSRPHWTPRYGTAAVVHRNDSWAIDNVSLYYDSNINCYQYVCHLRKAWCS